MGYRPRLGSPLSDTMLIATIVRPAALVMTAVIVAASMSMSMVITGARPDSCPQARVGRDADLAGLARPPRESVPAPTDRGMLARRTWRATLAPQCTCRQRHMQEKTTGRSTSPIADDSKVRASGVVAHALAEPSMRSATTAQATFERGRTAAATNVTATVPAKAYLVPAPGALRGATVALAPTSEIIGVLTRPLAPCVLPAWSLHVCAAPPWLSWRGPPCVP